MTLALFPITALLLLLSGVGSPARVADGRGSATALFKAILGSQSGTLAQRQQAVRNRGGKSLARQTCTARASMALPVASLAAGLQGTANRKAYRTRFGFAEGAHQPQGPPNREFRARLG